MSCGPFIIHVTAGVLYSSYLAPLPFWHTMNMGGSLAVLHTIAINIMRIYLCALIQRQKMAHFTLKLDAVNSFPQCALGAKWPECTDVSC